jgi:hypothetical protein
VVAVGGGGGGKHNTLAPVRTRTTTVPVGSARYNSCDLVSESYPARMMDAPNGRELQYIVYRCMNPPMRSATMRGGAASP